MCKIENKAKQNTRWGQEAWSTAGSRCPSLSWSPGLVVGGASGRIRGIRVDFTRHSGSQKGGPETALTLLESLPKEETPLRVSSPLEIRLPLNQTLGLLRLLETGQGMNKNKFSWHSVAFREHSWAVSPLILTKNRWGKGADPSHPLCTKGNG